MILRSTQGEYWKSLLTLNGQVNAKMAKNRLFFFLKTISNVVISYILKNSIKTQSFHQLMIITIKLLYCSSPQTLPFNLIKFIILQFWLIFLLIFLDEDMNVVYHSVGKCCSST